MYSSYHIRARGVYLVIADVKPLVHANTLTLRVPTAVSRAVECINYNPASPYGLQPATHHISVSCHLFEYADIVGWKGLPLWSSGQSSWLQNGEVLCFMRGTNWIYICYVEESRPPLWSSGQSSSLQFQKSGFDSRRYQMLWEVMGLERGPLSLVSTIEELLGRAAPVTKSEIMTVGIRHGYHVTFYLQKLALTSSKSSCCSVGIVRSCIQATEFFLLSELCGLSPRANYTDWATAGCRRS
jgi:hypothetical protein